MYLPRPQINRLAITIQTFRLSMLTRKRMQRATNLIERCSGNGLNLESGPLGALADAVKTIGV